VNKQEIQETINELHRMKKRLTGAQGCSVEYKGGNTSTDIELWRHKQQISNALAEIDKVIGG